ncbi:DUF4328 domain-containing protein [Belliella sp. R4-6]|uniref:DUF4328 domain-containing protein n=1 Tax=Belliella alkalica TaxID=1730871 RepID=A0ABS9VDM6_9BACT|nr:DUF4328 domain-containing protein [Belliella alkalica]MCH7414150.1 DUF4328 domain-containing protein [Belliella alkalica]
MFIGFFCSRSIYFNFLKRSFGEEVNLSTSWVASWWTLWFLSGLLGRILMQFLKKENNLENLISATEVDIAINLFGIPLTLVTIHVVKKYIDVERIMYDWIIDETQKPKSPEVE